MFYRQQPRSLRLGIGLEAQVLMSNSGADAYWIARGRAAEASSEQMAKDWRGVARAIARETGKRPGSLLAAIFH
jgi:hypothetical protein